jgi:hypothetical protein
MVRMMPRRPVMRPVSAPMMGLRLARRANSGHEQHWNNRYQSNLENVFHSKSPDS